MAFPKTDEHPQPDGFMRGVLPYLTVLLSVAGAWLLREVTDPFLHNFQPYPSFYLAVAFLAWRYGWRAAVFAQILGYLVGDWFFSPPRGSLLIPNLGQVLELLMYFAVTTTFIVLIRSLRKALALAKEKEAELEADIVLRKRLEEALAKRGEELEELVRQRTAKLSETIGELEGFSYSITHDMRAPLRAMQSFTVMIEAECAGCPRAASQDLFRRIKIASRRMDQLITDSLDYSKLVREEMALKTMDLAKLLRGMIQTYPNLQSPVAEVQLEFTELKVLGNEAGLTQCFSNLLGNAVKFVAAGVKPKIRVWAEEAPKPAPEIQHQEPPSLRGGGQSHPRVRIWIEDNGIGVPKEAHEKIFGMFQRMHRQDEYPGTGIGLTMVRKAVERMGGNVGLESEPGKGSRFWIELAKGEQL